MNHGNLPVMKYFIGVAVALISVGVPTLTYADVGPAPACPSGQHSEYLQGRRCVPDGMHLVKGPNGEITISGPVLAPPPADAMDAAAPMPPTSSSAAGTAATVTTPASTGSADSAPMPRAVEPKRNSGCSQADSSNLSGVLAILMGLAMVLRARKRSV